MQNHPAPLLDASSVIQLGGARVIANCTALDPAIAEDGGVDPLSTFVTEECFTVLARLLSSDNVACKEAAAGYMCSLQLPCSQW